MDQRQGPGNGQAQLDYMFKILSIVPVLAGLLLAMPPALGASDTGEGGEVSTAELEELVLALEDDGEREELVRRLKALIELRRGATAEARDQSLGGLLVEQMSLHSEALGRQVSALASALLGVPEALVRLRDGLADPATRTQWLEVLLGISAVLAVGLIAAGVIHRLLRRPLGAISGRAGEGLLLRLPLLGARLILILAPPAAFAVAGSGAAAFFAGESVARPVALAVIYAVAIAGAINAASRTILAPGAAVARPLAIGDETAQYLHIWVRRIAWLGIFGYFATRIAGLAGLSLAAQAFVMKFVGLVLALLAIMLILQNRTAVANWIGGAEGGRLTLLRRRLADLWQVLAILYVVVVYLVWAIGMPGGFAYIAQATALSALTVFAAFAITTFGLRAIDRGFALSPEIKARLPGLEGRVNRYLPAIKTVLRSLVWIVAAMIVLQAWGVDILVWLSTPEGRGVLARLSSIVAVVVLAIAGWEMVSAGIERYLSSGDVAANQRAQTLLPLIRKVVLVVLCVVVGLTVLSELGINIAPLLAGAGVVGLAVGFGAQTLVKDVITGLFILIEDTVSVGDYVTLGGHEGTVEALSIRSIRLRDPSGTVHTVPFSDVTSVINYTREFAFAVMQIGIGYGEDTDRVSTVIEEVGAELRRDPELAPSILEDLVVQGVDRFDDSAVVIKAKIKTAPGWQWAVRRAFNRLLKQRFDAEGIEIPFPQQTVWFAAAEEAETAAPDPKARLKPRPAKPAAATPGDEDGDDVP